MRIAKSNFVRYPRRNVLLPLRLMVEHFGSMVVGVFILAIRLIFNTLSIVEGVFIVCCISTGDTYLVLCLSLVYS